jgi:hypothetical protein
MASKGSYSEPVVDLDTNDYEYQQDQVAGLYDWRDNS